MDTHSTAALARELMDRHGLGDWALRFDTAKRRAGLCRYDKHLISLSKPLTALYSHEQVRETVLHEIAHALAGAPAGHGQSWRAVARRIGASGQRCVDPQAPTVPAPWVGRCRAGHRHERFRRPSRPMSCIRCAPRFSPEHLVHWRFHGEDVDLGPRYRAELDRLLRRQRAGRGPRRAFTS